MVVRLPLYRLMCTSKLADTLSKCICVKFPVNLYLIYSKISLLSLCYSLLLNCLYHDLKLRCLFIACLGEIRPPWSSVCKNYTMNWKDNNLVRHGWRRKPWEKNRPRDSVMCRLDHLNRKHGIDIYLCAKYKRYFEYTTPTSFRPTALDIVSVTAYRLCW